MSEQLYAVVSPQTTELAVVINDGLTLVDAQSICDVLGLRYPGKQFNIEPDADLLDLSRTTEQVLLA